MRGKESICPEFLADKGFKLDAESLDAMIEAAVFELNSGLF